MPGPGKPFEVFQADHAACGQYAEQQALRERARTKLVSFVDLFYWPVLAE